MYNLIHWSINNTAKTVMIGSLYFLSIEPIKAKRLSYKDNLFAHL